MEVMSRRVSIERPHREVVGAAIVDSELFCEIIRREEGMTGIEAFLVFSVTALYLTVMPGCVRLDELVPYDIVFETRLSLTQSTTKPVLGFRRRILQISFNSSSVCWLGWL